MQFLELCESLAACSSLSEFRLLLQSASAHLDFEWFSGFIVDSTPTSPDQGSFCLDFVHAPPGFAEVACKPEDIRADPVIQTIKATSRPVPWDKSFYVQAGKSSLWSSIAEIGYRTGIAMAVPLPRGRHFALGFESSSLTLGSRAALSARLADFALLTVNALGAAQSITANRAQPSPLSSRQTEVLHWTALGKTAWEIGRILGIGEPTVKKSLDQARDRLGCSSTTQAVALAIRCSLL